MRNARKTMGVLAVANLLIMALGSGAAPRVCWADEMSGVLSENPSQENWNASSDLLEESIGVGLPGKTGGPFRQAVYASNLFANGAGGSSPAKKGESPNKSPGGGPVNLFGPQSPEQRKIVSPNTAPADKTNKNDDSGVSWWDMIKWGAIGAGVGALIGLAAGHPGIGALIGAAVGIAAPYIWRGIKWLLGW